MRLLALGYVLVFALFLHRHSRVMLQPLTTSQDSSARCGTPAYESTGQTVARWIANFSPFVGLIHLVLGETLIPRNLGKEGDGIIRSWEEQMEAFRLKLDFTKTTIDSIQTQAEANWPSDETLTLILGIFMNYPEGVGTKLAWLKDTLTSTRATTKSVLFETRVLASDHSATRVAIERIEARQIEEMHAAAADRHARRRMEAKFDRICPFIPAPVRCQANPPVGQRRRLVRRPAPRLAVHRYGRDSYSNLNEFQTAGV
ncbi:hypothetical protein MGYG_09035 [Nannizzia gypsea CBS 118893]|uniref:Uncharacterized protein n=1 Tax=Arthroderma gypseum (strain ATCC MYA-4604 / CBS 118893) TaxID=535722 RepID=E4UU98_ARTGP|nr:hypothetical protein MGYG_09035 [Nannizzia gypsea CBS 118893]EFR00865.1 hypothetical protein MGYG_09035 [Nannizzia gypsea CBS 118893]